MEQGACVLFFFMVLWSKCGVVRAGWLCKNNINIWVWRWGRWCGGLFGGAIVECVGVRRPSSVAGHIDGGNFASRGVILVTKL